MNTIDIYIITFFFVYFCVCGGCEYESTFKIVDVVKRVC